MIGAQAPRQYRFLSRVRRCSSNTGKRTFTSSRASCAYDDTISNLKIGQHTRVIYQGFTGRVSTSNAQQSIDYGTNIVGGTTPNKEGEHLGLPLLPSVRKAAEELKPDASAVFVAAQHAAKAIEDAIEAEIPLIVAVAEFIPLHDMLRISAILKSQSKSRLVGANSPGIIAPLGNCRIGFQPLPCYSPGHVGVVAKSGTLSYESVGSLTRAGLGQSLCIGMGGDIVAGTNLVDALKLFEQDEDTHGIVLVGEVGGRAELDAAEWISDYRRRVKDPKPIAAAVAGVRAVSGRIMGHAGAFVSLGEQSSEVKAKALEDAGAVMVNHPSKFGRVMTQLLNKSGRDSDGIKSTPAQRRSYHTMRTNSHLSQQSYIKAKTVNGFAHRRSLHLESAQALGLLKDRGIHIAENPSEDQNQCFLAVTVNRSDRCPAIIASPSAKPGVVHQRSKTFSYDYNNGPDEATIKAIIETLQMAAPSSAMAAAAKLIHTLVDVFKTKEAYSLATHLAGTADGSLAVTRAEFGFDDSAFKSGKRQEDIHSLNNIEKADPDELDAAKDGIVYIKLEDSEAKIGTLINGAGLAMNAVDALIGYGARPTNFLDTGGKATSETVKKCFELLLKDERVRVIFVNIFGGLTLCDMIAEGIMMAFRDLDMKIPVVVRLRGTNEAQGQRMIAQSGLPLHAYDDFEEAANKCIELANNANSGVR